VGCKHRLGNLHRSVGTRLEDTSLSSFGSSASAGVESEAEGGVVVVADGEEESSEEDGANDNIEDGVEDHLVGGFDHVGTLRDTPADGVGDQHEGDVAGSEEVGAAVGSTGDGSGARAVPEESNPDVDHSGDTESVEAPLVGTAGQSTNEETDNSGESHEESGDDVGE